MYPSGSALLADQVTGAPSWPTDFFFLSSPFPLSLQSRLFEVAFSPPAPPSGPRPRPRPSLARPCPSLTRSCPSLPDSCLPTQPGTYYFTQPTASRICDLAGRFYSLSLPLPLAQPSLPPRHTGVSEDDLFFVLWRYLHTSAWCHQLQFGRRETGPFCISWSPNRHYQRLFPCPNLNLTLALCTCRLHGERRPPYVIAHTPPRHQPHRCTFSSDQFPLPVHSRRVVPPSLY